MSRETLWILFLAAVPLTLLFYVFLWRHRPYGRAKRFIEEARQRGDVVQGTQVSGWRSRHDTAIGKRSRWNRDRSYAKYTYTVAGRTYIKRRYDSDSEDFPVIVTVDYDAKRPGRLYRG